MALPIVFFDEIDKRLGKSVAHNEALVGAFQEMLSGIGSVSNMAVIAATNHWDHLSSAIQNRFHSINVPAPDLDGRCSLISGWLRSRTNCVISGMKSKRLTVPYDYKYHIQLSDDDI